MAVLIAYNRACAGRFLQTILIFMHLQVRFCFKTVRYCYVITTIIGDLAAFIVVNVCLRLVNNRLIGLRL